MTSRYRATVSAHCVRPLLEILAFTEYNHLDGRSPRWHLLTCVKPVFLIAPIGKNDSKGKRPPDTALLRASLHMPICTCEPVRASPHMQKVGACEPVRTSLYIQLCTYELLRTSACFQTRAYMIRYARFCTSKSIPTSLYAYVHRLA